MSAVRSLLRRLAFYYQRHPARTISFLASAVVFVAAKAGLVLPEASVAQCIATVAPILLGGQLIHDRVTPAPRVLKTLPPIEVK